MIYIALISFCFVLPGIFAVMANICSDTTDAITALVSLLSVVVIVTYLIK